MGGGDIEQDLEEEFFQRLLMRTELRNAHYKRLTSFLYHDDSFLSPWSWKPNNAPIENNHSRIISQEAPLISQLGSFSSRRVPFPELWNMQHHPKYEETKLEFQPSSFFSQGIPFPEIWNRHHHPKPEETQLDLQPDSFSQEVPFSELWNQCRNQKPEEDPKECEAEEYEQQ